MSTEHDPLSVRQKISSREAFEKWIKDNQILFVTKWAWCMWKAAEAHAKGEPTPPWNENTVKDEACQNKWIRSSE
jgi:hypothetical protein